MSDHSLKRFGRAAAGIAAGVFLLTLLPYLRTGAFDFVNYDDREFEALAVRPWDDSSEGEAAPLPVKLAGGSPSFEVPLA